MRKNIPLGSVCQQVPSLAMLCDICGKDCDDTAEGGTPLNFNSFYQNNEVCHSCEHGDPDDNHLRNDDRF